MASFLSPAFALAAMFAATNAFANVALFDLPFTDGIEVLQALLRCGTLGYFSRKKPKHCIAGNSRAVFCV